MSRRLVLAGMLVMALIMAVVFPPLAVSAQTCEEAARELNSRLSPTIDEQELAGMLNSLNSTGNGRLPRKFVTKAEARARGWRPGRNLWSRKALQGHSIGGDRFGNQEHRLPAGKWREADLDYHGGRRGRKRLLFSFDRQRFVTVDHYRTFMEVPSCRSK